MDVVGKIRMLDGLVYTYWFIQVQYSKLDGTVSLWQKTANLDHLNLSNTPSTSLTRDKQLYRH